MVQDALAKLFPSEIAYPAIRALLNTCYEFHFLPPFSQIGLTGPLIQKLLQTSVAREPVLSKEDDTLRVLCESSANEFAQVLAMRLRQIDNRFDFVCRAPLPKDTVRVQIVRQRMASSSSSSSSCCQFQIEVANFDEVYVDQALYFDWFNGKPSLETVPVNAPPAMMRKPDPLTCQQIENRKRSHEVANGDDENEHPSPIPGDDVHLLVPQAQRLCVSNEVEFGAVLSQRLAEGKQQVTFNAALMPPPPPKHPRRRHCIIPDPTGHIFPRPSHH
jgi:hypothetical protein